MAFVVHDYRRIGTVGLSAMSTVIRRRFNARLSTALFVSIIAHIALGTWILSGSMWGSSKLQAMPREFGPLEVRLTRQAEFQTDAPRLLDGGKLPDSVPITPIPLQASSPTEHSGSDATNQHVSPYLSASHLDRGPVPESGTDSAVLTGLGPTTAPVRLRVFVSASGNVDRVSVLQASVDDESAANRVAFMVKNARFLPGRKAGVDVASYVDLEFSIGPAQVIPFHREN